MDDPDLKQALRKLEEALHVLAVGHGDVRSRLADAWLNLGQLTERDFPPDLQPMFQSVERRMTARQPDPNDSIQSRKGSVKYTMENIQNRSASKIAQDVWALWEEVRRRVSNDH